MLIRSVSSGSSGLKSAVLVSPVDACQCDVRQRVFCYELRETCFVIAGFQVLNAYRGYLCKDVFTQATRYISAACTFRYTSAFCVTTKSTTGLLVLFFKSILLLSSSLSLPTKVLFDNLNACIF